jgi:hypothetical protein
MPLFTQGRLMFQETAVNQEEEDTRTHAHTHTDTNKKPPVLLSEDEKFLYCDLDALVFVKK